MSSKTLGALCGIDKANDKFNIEAIAKQLNGGAVQLQPVTWGSLALHVSKMQQGLFDNPTEDVAVGCAIGAIEDIAEIMLSSAGRWLMADAASLSVLGWHDTEQQAELPASWWPEARGWWSLKAQVGAWRLFTHAAANGGQLACLVFNDEGYNLGVWFAVNRR